MLHLNMITQARIFSSSIRAVRASEGFLAGVNPIVVSEMAFVTEFLYTQRAGVCQGRIFCSRAIWQLIKRYYVFIGILV